MKTNNINNEHGCSVCMDGCENYTTFHFSSRHLDKKYGMMIQYDYRLPDGRLFSCVAKTLEECRNRRDEWIKRNN